MTCLRGKVCTPKCQHVKCYLSSLCFCPPICHLSSFTLFRVQVSACRLPQPCCSNPSSKGFTVVNGLISCFHGHRKSCQSQYVRCYKSKPPTRALRHAPSTHSFACKHLHRKKQTHIRCNPLSQFCAKLMTLETLRRKLQYCVEIKYQNKYAQDIFFHSILRDSGNETTAAFKVHS